MLPKANRLSKQKEFVGVFSGGKTRQSDWLVLRIKPTRNAILRIGLVISSRAAKRAVVRNRLRRQIREILRGALGRIKKGFDLVLIVKSSLVGGSFGEIEADLLVLLKKAGLYD